MATRRKLIRLIDQSVQAQPIHKAFLMDLMTAIEVRDRNNRREVSRWYKPSSFVCLRQMYFMRIGEQPDDVRIEYNVVGMADTGTRRHEAIQEVLLDMNSLGYDWVYMDVEEYLKEKWEQGKCKNIIIKEKVGAETKLFDETLELSFMCDGIIKRKSTGEYYLFEFKNQISFKYNNKEKVDDEHIIQVSCYCMSLDLDKVFVVYENRDVCTLECPELLVVTDTMKEECVSKIFECDSYVEKLTPPPMHTDKKPCRWCKYQTACRRAGK